VLIRKRIGSLFNGLLRRNAHREVTSVSKKAIQDEEQARIEKNAPQKSFITDKMLLSEKSVLITGAGRNIGRSIAIEMAEQGAHIFFTDIDAEQCETLEKELQRNQVRVKGFLSDVSKTEDIDSLCHRLNRENIHIDVLVHNAGVRFESKHLKDIDMNDLYRSFQTNVLGPLYLTKHISGMMMSKNVRGCILFVTSIHQSVLSQWISYSASKAALEMIIRELAMELAEHGIRVNGIAPGWVAEDKDGNTYPFDFAPLHGSSISPCFIGRAAVYLSSEYFSKFTTGMVITVDAGLSLHSYLTLREKGGAA
jgi:NAD(P)-dependent dehydrogenase (short-subunit alcohol dehydrogenase family)